MSGEKSKVAVAFDRTPEQAEARIEYLKTQLADAQKQHEAQVGHLYGQIASLQKQHQDAMAAKVEAHNKDSHQRNEAYAAIQQQLMAAQDLICKLQDQLLKVRQVANQPL
jgi:chromosome segregation ATPase